jgi:hypothetical protein
VIRSVIKAIAATLALWLLPVAASAQTAAALDLSAAEQPSQGPMIVERVHNGFLVVPEFKFTEVDRRSAGLAGAYAGLVIDERFFIGGGGYVLTAERRGRDLAYGGLVLQWLGASNDVFAFSAKTLLGGGSTESSGTIQILDRGQAITYPFRSRQSFFVAEPEVDLLIHFTDHIGLAVGAGYRFTGSDRYDRDLGIPDSRLSGAVGSIGLRIGGGS